MKVKIMPGLSFFFALAIVLSSCISAIKPGGNAETHRLPNALGATDEIQQQAGQQIWFKSAPNERHHTYVFPQKIGVAIDFMQVFDANLHESRFQTWGVINDPDCCVPGVSCEQKNQKFNGRAVTLVDTYGWEYCKGDEDLLNALHANRANQYRDPACDDALVLAADHAANQFRENRCELKFGTSAGAVGFRKFPNPRFNANRWEKIGGYKTYSENIVHEGMNNSIQPPFRVATACAACHAGFDPLRPPPDTANPDWAHIKGEVGNQFIQISKLMANGMQPSTIEAQLFTHTRPGTADTSAVPHDFINNPGTINAIINFPQRPLFDESVVRWNQIDTCDERETETCQKVAYKNEKSQTVGFKFWRREKSQMKVPHILKGGEDSVGYDLAVQRVYANTGMCSEECWQNSLTNLRELDFTSRGYGETAFNIAQCRQQCGAFRANEDRVFDILSYLTSRRSNDLKDVLPQAENELEKKYGRGSIQRGQKIFATQCASCHSSTTGTDFQATTKNPDGRPVRIDWMGNDRSVPFAAVGTESCRALHSNHKRGNVWDEFSSETHKNLPSTGRDTFGRPISGGPGYYRNISLLNVWAYAPFLHNNSVGPEICGGVRTVAEAVQTQVQCNAGFKVSVADRLQIYDQSMDELLTPSAMRRPKITRLSAPVKFPLGFKDLVLEFPAGLPLNTIANFDLKTFIYDFSIMFPFIEEKQKQSFQNYLLTKFSQDHQKSDELGDAIEIVTACMTTMTGALTTGIAKKLNAIKTISKYYRTCETGDDVDNKGHDFGTGLAPADKMALKAFMATL